MAPTMPATRDRPAHEVLVIGGGVIGLSAAATLLEAGYSVQIAARELGEGTTSAVAAAFWYPYRAYPEDQVTRLAAVSLRRFAALMDDASTRVLRRDALEIYPPPVDAPTWSSAADDIAALMDDASTGVLRRDALEIYPAPVDAPTWSSAADDFAVAEPHLLPPGYGFGHRFRTAVVETPIYLEWLRRRVVALGGRVERRPIASLDAALAECPRVINCAGLGARELTDDRVLRPVRGQVVRVENPGLTRVWIDEHSGHGITYIVPRSRDVVLGGTSEDDQEDRTPDPRHTREIVARCAALEPRLADARIVSVGVGLRPARTPLRLETEVRPGGLVVHNYGHGGAGVTLSWGCAAAVRDLLQGSVPA